MSQDSNTVPICEWHKDLASPAGNDTDSWQWCSSPYGGSRHMCPHVPHIHERLSNCRVGMWRHCNGSAHFRVKVPSMMIAVLPITSSTSWQPISGAWWSDLVFQTPFNINPCWKTFGRQVHISILHMPVMSAWKYDFQCQSVTNRKLQCWSIPSTTGLARSIPIANSKHQHWCMNSSQTCFWLVLRTRG